MPGTVLDTEIISLYSHKGPMGKHHYGNLRVTDSDWGFKRCGLLPKVIKLGSGRQETGTRLSPSMGTHSLTALLRCVCAWCRAVQVSLSPWAGEGGVLRATIFVTVSFSSPFMTNRTTPAPTPWLTHSFFKYVTLSIRLLSGLFSLGGPQSVCLCLSPALSLFEI